jgi:hypothetical protein
MEIDIARVILLERRRMTLTTTDTNKLWDFRS